MSFTQTYTGTLIVQACIECGMHFGIDKTFNDERMNDHESWCCPAGHKQHYPQKSDKEKLQDEIDSLGRRLHWANNTIEDKRNQIQQLNYSVRAQKAAKTKILNRVKNGVCPCCNRTFSNLQNHFKTKHPELLTDK